MGKKTTVATLATSRRKVKRPARASGRIAATENGRGGRASMKKLHADYQATFAALPDDYESLKDQAVYLGKLSGHAFVLMAARLKRIRDLELYREGGYASFKEFVEAEMPVDRSTIYSHMSILEAFGESTLLSREELEYSKLAPAVPILTSKATGIPKAKIRRRFIDKARTSTRREIAKEARELKTRYGLTSPSSAKPRNRRGAEKGAGVQGSSDLAAAVSAFEDALPDGPLSKVEKQRLRLLVKRLTAMIARPGR